MHPFARKLPTIVHRRFLRKIAREWTNTHLNKIQERKGDFFRGVPFAPPRFRFAKLVVRLHKHFNNSLQRFKLSRKTPTSPRKNWDVMPQIGIHAFNCKRIFFIADILDVLAWIYHLLSS
jgi:hypothetical protein